MALTASAPRFLTLGDEARFDLSLHNVDGPAGSYKAALLDTTEGETAVADRTLELKNGERKGERVDVKPTDVGLRTYDVRVTGPDGISVSRRLTFDVKPPAGDIKRTTVSQDRRQGRQAHAVEGSARRPHRQPHASVNVSVGPAATMDVPGLLTALDRYPYGCAEQTVSRALPLVYANAVAAQLGIAPDKELKERVQGAIERVFEMQDSSGGFGTWGPSYIDLWLTSYVTDFLTRAKENGYTVRELPFNQALDRLQNFALNGENFDRGGEDRAYALYVLARNGRAPHRRAALLRRHQARQLHDAAGQGSARRRALHGRRQGAGRDRVQGCARRRSARRRATSHSPAATTARRCVMARPS